MQVLRAPGSSSRGAGAGWTPCRRRSPGPCASLNWYEPGASGIVPAGGRFTIVRWFTTLRAGTVRRPRPVACTFRLRGRVRYRGGRGQTVSRPVDAAPTTPGSASARSRSARRPLFAAVCAVSMLIYGIEPVNKPFLTKLALIPEQGPRRRDLAASTWPIANGFDDRLLWVAVTIALLWYFGGRLEAQVGRTKFGIFLTRRHRRCRASSAPCSISRRRAAGPVQLAVLLVFVAEYPNMRFFFGIPAWALGLVVRGHRHPPAHGIARRRTSALLRDLARHRGRGGPFDRAARGVSVDPTGADRRRRPHPPATPGAAATALEGRPADRRRRAVGDAVGRPEPTSLAAQAELDSLLDKIAATGWTRSPATRSDASTNCRRSSASADRTRDVEEAPSRHDVG